MNEIKNFLSGVIALISLISGATSAILGICLIFLLPDACTGDTFETWDGVDHYYNGTESYLLTLAIFVGSLIIFLITNKLLEGKK